MTPRSFPAGISVVCGLLLVLFSRPCLAPAAPAPGDRGPEAAAYLRGRLAQWQHRLKLDDWKISLVVARSSSLRRGTLGNIHWDADKQTAVIRVLDPSDYQTSFSAAVKDMEFTVVHELIHLELSSLTRDFKNRSEDSFSKEENAVNQMAGALLELDPGTPGQPPTKAQLTAPSQRPGSK